MPENKRKKNNGKGKKASVPQPKQATKQARKPRVERQGKTEVVISNCAASYARCVANPFTGPLACVPRAPSIMSRSLRVWVKSEFRTGTGGIGYVSMDVENMVAYDLLSVFHTTSTSTSSTINTFPLGTNDVGLSSNSEFPQAQYANTASGSTWRMVAAALRIRYIGTELNRGGTIIAFQDPSNTTVAGRGVGSLLSEESSVKFPVNREWITVNWRPVLAIDYDFQYADGFAVTEAPLCFMVESPDPAVPMVFEFEASAVFEINGRTVRGMKGTETDTVGFDAVHQMSQNSLELKPSAVPATVKEKNSIEKVAEYIHKGTSHVQSAANVARGLAEDAKVLINVAKMFS